METRSKSRQAPPCVAPITPDWISTDAEKQSAALSTQKLLELLNQEHRRAERFRRLYEDETRRFDHWRTVGKIRSLAHRLIEAGKAQR
jgi:hypothetical protein